MMWYNKITKRFPTSSLVTTIHDKKCLFTVFLIFLILMMLLSLTSLRKLWFSTTPSTTRRMWTLWMLLRPLTPKPRLPKSELLSKLRSGSTVEVRWRDLAIHLLKMLIAIDQDTLITPYSGRILRLPREMEVNSRRDLLKLPLSALLEASTTLKRSSTPLLLESKDLDGAGSYVS